MPENMLMSTLNMEMYRRMTNTSEMVEIERRVEIVDLYGQKLTNSGFGIPQIRKAIVGGLVRYERRLVQSVDKSAKEWRPLHENARYNEGARRLKKVLAKTDWYKKKRKHETDGDVVEDVGSTEKRQRKEENRLDLDVDKSKVRKEEGVRNDLKGDLRHGDKQKNTKKKIKKPEPPKIGAMFVEQTAGGMLAKMLQEVEDRLASITGYRIRITEMSGSKLCRVLPNTNPWGNQDCLRGDCFTCSQPGEKLENCKERNILYETMCAVCNKEGVEMKQKSQSKWKEFKTMVGVYVGETARSLYERVGEHWQDVQGGKEESHMLKHWQEFHSLEEDGPRFKVRKVSSFRDSLTRQISESVRIDLRGENVLTARLNTVDVVFQDLL